MSMMYWCGYCGKLPGQPQPPFSPHDVIHGNGIIFPHFPKMLSGRIPTCPVSHPAESYAQGVENLGHFLQALGRPLKNPGDYVGKLSGKCRKTAWKGGFRRFCPHRSFRWTKNSLYTAFSTHFWQLSTHFPQPFPAGFSGCWEGVARCLGFTFSENPKALKRVENKVSPRKNRSEKSNFGRHLLEIPRRLNGGMKGLRMAISWAKNG